MFQLTFGDCDAFLQFVFPEMPSVFAALGDGLPVEVEELVVAFFPEYVYEMFKGTAKSLWRSPSLWDSHW